MDDNASLQINPHLLQKVQAFYEVVQTVEFDVGERRLRVEVRRSLDSPGDFCGMLYEQIKLDIGTPMSSNYIWVWKESYPMDLAPSPVDAIEAVLRHLDGYYPKDVNRDTLNQ
jgi:hypothetical protein